MEHVLLLVTAEYQEMSQTHRHISNFCGTFANIPLFKVCHKPSPKSRGGKVHSTTSKRGCKVTWQRMWIQAEEGKKIGGNDAVYHRFPPPAWGTQGLLPGTWPVIEVSDSSSGSQNSSMMWPYLIWTGLLLNIDRVSSGWGLSPGIQ